MAIKAIETTYRGYKFRSRLEARWAIFFDSLRLEWEYEPEGYELADGARYLPDFYLPSIGPRGLWVEIKAKGPTPDEVKKLEALVVGTKRDGTFRVGEPAINVALAIGDDKRRQDGSFDSDNAWAYFPHEDSVGGDGPYLFCTCPWCGKIGFQFDGRGARVCGYRKHHATEEEAMVALWGTRHEGLRVDDKCYSADDQRIVFAAEAARAARFEHGAHYPLV
jgi:hypothetical protein